MLGLVCKQGCCDDDIRKNHRRGNLDECHVLLRVQVYDPVECGKEPSVDENIERKAELLMIHYHLFNVLSVDILCTIDSFLTDPSVRCLDIPDTRNVSPFAMNTGPFTQHCSHVVRPEQSTWRMCATCFHGCPRLYGQQLHCSLAIHFVSSSYYHHAQCDILFNKVVTQCVSLSYFSTCKNASRQPQSAYEPAMCGWRCKGFVFPAIQTSAARAIAYQGVPQDVVETPCHPLRCYQRIQEWTSPHDQRKRGPPSRKSQRELPFASSQWLVSVCAAISIGPSSLGSGQWHDHHQGFCSRHGRYLALQGLRERFLPRLPRQSRAQSRFRGSLHG